jgi:hypothetical protein
MRDRTLRCALEDCTECIMHRSNRVLTCLRAPSALSALSACLPASSTFSAAKLRWTVASVAVGLWRMGDICCFRLCSAMRQNGRWIGMRIEPYS